MLDEHNKRASITVTVEFFYDCPADVTTDQQSDLIHDDFIRLLDADSTTNVVCGGFTINNIVGDGADDTPKATTHLICSHCGSTT